MSLLSTATSTIRESIGAGAMIIDNRWICIIPMSFVYYMLYRYFEMSIPLLINVVLGLKHIIVITHYAFCGPNVTFGYLHTHTPLLGFDVNCAIYTCRASGEPPDVTIYDQNHEDFESLTLCRFSRGALRYISPFCRLGGRGAISAGTIHVGADHLSAFSFSFFFFFFFL